MPWKSRISAAFRLIQITPYKHRTLAFLAPAGIVLRSAQSRNRKKPSLRPLKHDHLGSFGHIIPCFFLLCKRRREKLANQKECSVAERDDGIPVIAVAAVKNRSVKGLRPKHPKIVLTYPLGGERNLHPSWESRRLLGCLQHGTRLVL